MQSRASRRFLVIIGLLVGALSLLIVLPYLNWILIAVILAFVLAPIDAYLARRFGFGPGLSAGISILVGLVLVVLPVIGVLGVAANQAQRVVTELDPGNVSQIDDALTVRFGIQVDFAVVHDAFSGAIKTGARGLVGNLFSIVGGIPELLIGFTVMFFVLFYLLKDSADAVEWLRRMLPLDSAVREELFEETGLLLHNSLVGTAVVAGAQALLVGIAFVVVGLSNAVFWIVTTFIAAMVPLVGASVIWIPASIYLVLIGRSVSGVALFVFGALVVSSIDNVLRPIVMRRGAQLSPVLTIIGIFGGISLFGFVGLFIGPIVLGTLKLVIEILVRERPDPPPM